MKTSFKTLSFIFFIPLLLLIYPLHSQAEEEASIQTKDIKIYEGKEIIYVSIEDIKERILNGKPVNFVWNQEETKRTIKSKWITDALKKEYSVEKIDIKNAIITGDLDFHMKENLLDIEESGIEEDEIKKLKDSGIEKAFLVSPSINIESCQLQGNLKAGFDINLKSVVIFESSISFYESKFVEEANFKAASFNGVADFMSANFKDVIVFSGCIFLSDINLQDANYQVLRISWKQLQGRLDRTFFGIFNLPEDIKNVLEGKKTVDAHLEEQMRDILSVENIILWEHAYLRLIKNFEDIGDKKSADDAYYHYRYNKPKFETQHLSERSENIGELPISLEFPEHLKSKIDYKNEQLIFKGVMTKEEKKELLGCKKSCQILIQKLLKIFIKGLSLH